MRFNPKARLDPGQVRVRSGGGRSGGAMLPGGLPGGMKVGGGIGGIIVLVVVLLLSGVLGGGSGGGAGGGLGFPAAPDAASVDTTGVSGVSQCQDGDDANSNEQCALVASVNSVQAFWSEALPEQSGTDYTPATTVLFTGSVSTGCGGATSSVGPFYCPVDRTVYLDRTFFRDMLQGQLGAHGGAFSEAYVLAHEYGHHIQNLLGTMGEVRTQQGPESDAVRLELQADCYAGMWGRYATEVEDSQGNVFILDLTEQDVADAIDAAQAVGDDRIQQRTSGRVDPDQWTHGSAAARTYWFRTGMTKGTLDACDTFSADDLHLDG
jgi:predicted metalloprotease